MGELVAGPLLAFEVGYVRWLVERGFRPGAVVDRLGQFRALSRWLGTHRLPVADLDPGQVEEFLDARRAAGYRSYVAASSVRLPLDYLIGIGVAPLLGVSTALRRSIVCSRSIAGICCSSGVSRRRRSPAMSAWHASSWSIACVVVAGLSLSDSRRLM